MLSKKRILTAAMAVIMVFGLAACSNNAADSKTQTTTETTQAQTSTQTQETTAPVEKVETTAEQTSTPVPSEFEGIKGLSKYDPPITVTYARSADPNVTFAPGQDYMNNIWMTEYRDILGIDLRTAWTTEGSQSYDEKLQLQILSQSLPDVFSCNAALFTSLVGGGMIEDLTDVYEEYAYDPLKQNALLGDGGLCLEQASVNGRLYGVPSGNVSAGAYEFLFIREDWREQLGLPVPKTMDDVVAMAKAFVENDPDGMSAYGFGISNQPFETYFSIRGFCDAFGANMRQWVKNGDKLEYGLVQPEMKTALAAFNDWYNQGLIDPEYVVKDSYTMSQEAIGGRVGIVTSEWWLTTWPLPDGYKLGQNWKAYMIPFASSNTTQKYSAEAKLDARYVVRKGYENPEALLKMCNLYQERALNGNYPAEIYRTDGEFHYNGLAAFQPNMGPDRNSITQRNITTAVDTGDPSILLNDDEVSKYTSVTNYINNVDADNPDAFATNFMWWRAYYGPESIFALMGRMKDETLYKLDEYYVPPTSTMSELMGQLDSRASEVINNIITGADSIDAFDAFVQEWYDNGGTQLTQEVNDWYNSVN